jgi:hypothetical protein
VDLRSPASSGGRGEIVAVRNCAPTPRALRTIRGAALILCDVGVPRASRRWSGAIDRMRDTQPTSVI